MAKVFLKFINWKLQKWYSENVCVGGPSIRLKVKEIWNMYI